MIIACDPDAEAAVIGCSLLSPQAAQWAVEWLRPSDFYRPKWRAAHSAVVSLHGDGLPVDAVTVADRAKLLGFAEITLPDLLESMSNTPPPSRVRSYGQIIRRLSVARSASAICAAAAADFNDREKDPDELLDALVADLQSIDSHVQGGAPDGFLTFEDLRAKPAEQRAPWVIAGYLRSDWRAVLVGVEGSGKTIVLRQLAVMAASGLSPFLPNQRINPVRSLLVDLENPEDHLLDWVDRLCRSAESVNRQTDGRGAVWHKPGGIDLRKRVHRGQFEEVLRAHRPDLVCLGPLYKAYRRVSSRESDEEAAGEMQEILDDLRTRYHFALVMEHHAPKAQGGVRDLNPFGSSLWLRWGEIRMSLKPPDRKFPVMSMSLEPFSGSRMEHGWPDRIVRNRSSGGLPWLGEWDMAPEDDIPEEDF